tara:strand:+ start:4144 stop:5076 length:933 start_codon:yes stop_codon:yes gene_type:complete
MFSLVFPGQGSQTVGMAKEFYENFDLVKKLFKEADEILNINLTKNILEGPKEKLDMTENTQPAIFLVGYSIFQVALKEFNIKLDEAKFLAGHSLGEYTALSCAQSLQFKDALKILKIRGYSMQNAVPLGEGGMIAVLGISIEELEKILQENKNNFSCYIANDNSVGQVVVSGKTNDLEKLTNELKIKKIKNIKLPVSAPFHCPLMKKATEIMKPEIEKVEIKMPNNKILSNVSAKEAENVNDLKNLLISQIESRVRWREIINNIIDKNCNNFVEIGPGKVLSGMIKRVSKNVNINSINTIDDIKNLKIHD